MRPVETHAGVVRRQVTDACGADDRSGMDGSVWSRCRRATSGPAVLSERDDGTALHTRFCLGRFFVVVVVVVVVVLPLLLAD